MKWCKKATALFLAVSMAIGMITLPEKAAATEVNSGEILIENPTNEALVKTTVNKAVSAGSTVSFEVEVSEAKSFAVWLLGNGGWDKEYYAKGYSNTTSTGTITVAIPADIDSYDILVQYRNSDGTADTTTDKTGVYAVVKDLKVTKDNVTEGWDGSVLLTNPNDASRLIYDCAMYVPENGTISFDVEIGGNSPKYAVWIYEDTKEYYACQYNNTNTVQSVSDTNAESMKQFRIIIEFRNSSGGKYTEADLAECTAKITNLKVTRETATTTLAEGMVTRLNNSDGGPTQEYYIYDTIPAGSTLSFDLDFNLNEGVAVWVIGDGDWNSSASGGGEFFAYGYDEWTGERHYDVVTTKDVSNLQIAIQYRGANANNTANMATIRNLELVLAEAEPEPDNQVSLTYSTQATSCATDPSARYNLFLDGFTDAQRTEIKGTKPTVWIDGKEVSHDQMFYAETSKSGVTMLTIPYDVLESGKTTVASLEMPHTIWIKAGTTIGVYTVAEDVIVQLNGTTLKNVTAEPMTLKWVKGSVQDNNKRYLITLNSGKTSVTTYSDNGLVVDGVYRTDLVQTGFADKAAAEDGTRDIYFYIPYSNFESQATSSWTELTEEHIVIIRAGTVVLGQLVAEDFAIKFSQNTITQCEVPVEETPKEVELTYSAQATSTATDASARYNLFLDGFTDAQRTEIKGTKPSVWIDGKEVSHDQMFYAETSKSGVTMLTIPYDVLESGKTTVASLEMPHTIWIKARTTIGAYTVTKDVIVQLNGTTLKNVTAEPMTLKWVKGSVQDNNKRYLITLNSGKTSVTTYSDNGLVVDGVYRTDLVQTGFADKAAAEDGTRDIYFYIPYSNFESQATDSWEQLTEDHTVVVRAGTIVLGYMVTEDFGMSFSGNTITAYDPNQEPDLIEPEVVDAVTVSVEGTALTVNGTGTIKASDLASITAADITKIQIEGPCDIDSQAFVGFTALKEVYFSNTVLTAADDAFSGCASGVKAIYVKDRSVTGGLADVDAHEYYSFKVVTIGSSYGEDMNNYIYTLAKEYYGSLPGRTAEDIAYDDIVIAELFTGGGTLAQRVNGILGNPVITCYYEKWDENGAVIPTAPTGELTGDNMRMALQDEYWDVVIMMQSAEDSRNASSFLADTAGAGRADIDTVINFIKANNKNHSGSQYMWLQTWSYNYKLNDSDYDRAVADEEEMRLGIANSMQTVVQERIDAGALDGIVPAGAAIENFKHSWLNAQDPNYVSTYESGTYNEGNYSNYFSIQRDTAHASIGLGRFTLGLTAFSYLAGLETEEIEALSEKCYPQNYEECQVSTKLEGEQAQTRAYLKYDESTKDYAPQAAQAAIYALEDPYNTYEIEEPCRHVFDQKVASEATLKEAATCGKDAQYYYSCACGVISTTEFYTAEGTATGAHTGGTATCKNPAQCSICDVSYGERDAKNHDHGSLKMGTVKVALYGHDDVKVSWSKVKDATSYTVYYKKATAKKYTKLTTTTKTYATKAGLSDGIKYTFKVVANNTENKITCSGTEKAVSIYTLKKLNAPKLSRASSSKVKITWKNIDGESGYEISQSTKKSKTKVVYTYRTTSGKSRTIKAKAGQTFYYKVRAYKTVNGKKIYSPWSNVKSYKLKK